VGDGALFHIRIRAARDFGATLTEPKLAASLLAAALQYHETENWWCQIFLLMPDHLHALMAFPRETGMSAAVRKGKRCTARLCEVSWQGNYFDHRIRTKKEAAQKWWYIRQNPVVKGLCATVDDWPWWWGDVSPRRPAVPTWSGLRP
jgi:putative transposase